VSSRRTTCGSPTGSSTPTRSWWSRSRPICGIFRRRVGRRRRPLVRADLLRWFRFLWAVEIGWDVEARDFCRWLQIAGRPTRQRWRRRDEPTATWPSADIGRLPGARRPCRRPRPPRRPGMGDDPALHGVLRPRGPGAPHRRGGPDVPHWMAGVIRCSFDFDKQVAVRLAEYLGDSPADTLAASASTSPAAPPRWAVAARPPARSLRPSYTPSAGRRRHTARDPALD
jgi:hypothetical protein